MVSSKFLPDILKEWADLQKKPTRLAALFSPEHGLLGTQEAFAFINSEQKANGVAQTILFMEITKNQRLICSKILIYSLSIYKK
jgi:hypothetical protein